MKEIISNNEKDTVKLGEHLAKGAKPGDFFALYGDLGSGKTVLTKGIAKGLGVKDPTHVNSPSFVLIKEYKGRLPLYHFDVYRLESGDILDTVAYEEYFYGKGVTVCEWADKIKGILPERRTDIKLFHMSAKKRRVQIEKL